MKGIGLAAAGGLLLRLALALIVHPHIQPVSDASTYHGLALVLADGRGYINPYLWAAHRQSVATAQFPPLFPTVLAGAALAGVRSLAGQRVVGCVLGTATIVVTGLLGRRVAGARAGVAAAALTAVDPLLIGGDAALMSESLAALLVALLAVTALWVADRPHGAGRWLVLGGLIGLAGLTRGEGLLLVAVVALPLGFAVRPHVLSGIALAVVAAACIAAPWVVRNHATFHQAVISDDAGSALAGANCGSTYHGADTGLWLLACDDAVPTPGLTEARADAVMRRAGVLYARAHAGRVPAVAGVRVSRTLGVWNPGQQATFESLEGRVRALQLAGYLVGWLLAVPAIAGAAALWRLRPVFVALVGPVGLSLAVAAATYGNTRFRDPVEPLVIVLAVAGATRWLGST